MQNLLLHISIGGPWEVFTDALIDSAVILPFLFLVHVLMAAIDRLAEQKTYNALKGPLSPLIGTAAGVFPQCGFSVAAARMYSRKYIPLGALIAVFIATSDEAIFIILKDGGGLSKLLPLLLIKVFYALIAGYALNFIVKAAGRKNKKNFLDGDKKSLEAAPYSENSANGSLAPAKNRIDTPCGCGCHTHNSELSNSAYGNTDISTPYGNYKFTSADNGILNTGGSNHNQKNHDFTSCGCGCHDEGKSNQGKLSYYLWHPLKHSLVIFLYILAVNLIIGYILFFVTFDRVESFMLSIGPLQPIFAGLVGLIPNCAASVIVAEMYADGLLTLGAAVAGLSAGAGIGVAVLIKENKNRISSLLIVAGMLIGGIFVGTITDFVCSFL